MTGVEPATLRLEVSRASIAPHGHEIPFVVFIYTMEKQQTDMNERKQRIQKDRKFMDIQLKIDGYRQYNDKITTEMEQYLNVLDEKYSVYQYYLNAIHISIIVLSSVSSFLLASQPYIHNSHAGIHLSTLCVSTYTSLLLSIAKFMKLDERKESLYRLRSAFAEFLIEVYSRNDLLESWSSHHSWKTTENVTHQLSDMMGLEHHQDFEICFEEWNDLERKLKEQMRDIIVKKQELCSQYAQEMDNHTKYRSELSSKRRVLKHRIQMQKLEDVKDENDLDVGFQKWVKRVIRRKPTSQSNTENVIIEHDPLQEITQLEKLHEETKDPNQFC